jgi:hypothetical protein
MKFASLAAFAVLFFLSSCEKNTENNFPEVEKLVKTVEKFPVDSVVTLYSYDSEDRLSRIDITGKQSGTDRGSQFVIKRDGSGIVTETIEKTAQLLSVGCDSVLSRFHFSQAQGKYLYVICTADYPGNFVYDSILYQYDAAGRIKRQDHYQRQTPGPFNYRFVIDYVYSANGNIDSANYKDIDMSTGLYTASSSLVYSYDNKLNSLWLHEEAVLFYQFPFSGANNSTVFKSVVYNTPPQVFTMSSAHTYDGDGRPATSVVTRSNGLGSEMKWFYQ